jgi:hypothetical protein
VHEDDTEWDPEVLPTDVSSDIIREQESIEDDPEADGALDHILSWLFSAQVLHKSCQCTSPAPEL